MGGRLGRDRRGAKRRQLSCDRDREDRRGWVGAWVRAGAKAAAAAQHEAMREVGRLGGPDAAQSLGLGA